MKTHSRIVVILLLTLSLLPLGLWGVVRPASAEGLAQGTGCITGVTAADCKLFKDASAATLPDTFELGYSFKVNLSGAGSGNMEVTLKGSGPFDTSRVDGNTLNAIVEGLTLSNEGTLSYTVGGRSTSLPLELRFVEGTLYINVALSAGADGTWYKLSLDPLLKESTATFDLNSMNQFVRPDSFVFGLGSVILPSGKAEAKAGPVLDGRTTRQITIRIDYGKIYDEMLDFQRDIVLKAFFGSVLRSAGKGQSLDFDKNPKLKASAERFVRSLKIDVSWLAEPKGKTLRGFGMTVQATIDALVGKMLSPAFANGTTNLSVDMQFTYSKLGQSVSVEAPDRAIDLLPFIQNKTSA